MYCFILKNCTTLQSSTHILRRYKTKDIVEKIEIEKYQENGFEDIKREFLVNKAKAQRTLKYFHERRSFYG